INGDTVLTLNDEQGHVRCLTAQPVVARQHRKRRQGLIKVMSDSDHSILTSYEHTHTHTHTHTLSHSHTLSHTHTHTHTHTQTVNEAWWLCHTDTIFTSYRIDEWIVKC